MGQDFTDKMSDPKNRCSESPKQDDSKPQPGPDSSEHRDTSGELTYVADD